MENEKRKAFLSAVCIGLIMFVACGSPNRNAGRGDTQNHAAANAEDLANDSMEDIFVKKTGLLENASPDTCALALYYYDGATTTVRYLYDAEKEKEILQQLNGLPYEKADLEQLNDWQVPCYGLEISDMDGMDLCVSYMDGLWLNQNKEVYAVSVDFGSIWKGLEGEDEDTRSVLAFPNAGILCRYDMRFLEESGSEDEYGISTLPLTVTMTVTDISDGVATAVIDNQSGQHITYGEDYSLKKKVDGKWYELPFAETNIGFNAVAIYLPDLEQATVTCDLKVFGELGEGEYMLVKEDGLEAEFSLDEEGHLK